MLKSLKDVRRRVSQTIAEKVVGADVTVDEEYDASVTHFKEMLSDMNECGATLHTMMNDQRKGLEDAQLLANSLARIYERNSELTTWPNAQNDLQSREASILYKEKWDAIFNVIRSSCFMVNSEFALDPLKAAVTKMGPEVDSICKQRNLDVKDYDSYARRLKGLEQKKEQMESQGKGNTPAALENDAEIEKFRLKMTNGKEQYEASNTRAKAEMIGAKKAHDAMMDQLLTTTVVCQYELFVQAAKQLEAILASLPANRVEQARKSINQYVSEGGITMVQEEKSKFQKGLDIATGKAVLSDFKKADEGAGATTNKNPFGGDSSAANAPPPVPSQPSPVKSPSGGPEIVTALFDHEVDEDDELPFSVGDKIEVLEKADGGWWKGRCHGKEGLFPTNYVQ